MYLHFSISQTHSKQKLKQLFRTITIDRYCQPKGPLNAIQVMTLDALECTELFSSSHFFCTFNKRS